MPRRLETVDIGHLAIHQHDVVLAARNRVDRLATVGDRVRTVAQLLQLLQRELAVHRVVLRDQHQHALALLDHRVDRRRGRRDDAGSGQRGDQRVVQRALPDRLADDRGEAAGARVGRVRRLLGARDQHHRNGFESGQAAQARSERERIAAGAAVDDDHVERPAPGRGFGELERLRGVPRARRDGAPGEEILVDHLARDRLLVDDQDARAAQRFAALGVRGVDDARERDGEPERRAAPEAAVEADLAAHQLDDTARDRQPETRAAEASARRLIGLAERLEELLRDLGRDPGARVGDREAQHDAELALDAVDDGARRHAPGGGELHRVSEQVQQHLAQAVGVAEHAARDVRGDIGREREPLLARGGGQDVGRVLDRDDRRERDALQLHPAGLDLREVEDVVDDRQQRLGRVAHGGRVLARFFVERRLQQQLGHPDDRVDRRADLVAHRRQELRLYVGRLDRAVVRGADRLFGRFALGDVAQDDDRLAEGVRDVAAARELDREQRPARVAPGRLDDRRLADVRDARVLRQDARDRRAGEILGDEAEQRGRGRVHRGDRGARVDGDQRVGDAVHDAAQAALVGGEHVREAVGLGQQRDDQERRRDQHVQPRDVPADAVACAAERVQQRLEQQRGGRNHQPQIDDAAACAAQQHQQRQTGQRREERQREVRAGQVRLRHGAPQS